MSSADRSSPGKRWQKTLQYLLIAVIFGVALYNTWRNVQTPRFSPAQPSTIQTSAEEVHPPAAKTQATTDNSATSRPNAAREPERSPSSQQEKSNLRLRLENQTIRNTDGEVIFRGTVDLTDTLDRIQRGKKLSQFRHDGITFENRERRLPLRAPGYYREWVHPTPDEPGPGPQRVISGKSGEFWYTSNHYRTFIQLNE